MVRSVSAVSAKPTVKPGKPTANATGKSTVEGYLAAHGRERAAVLQAAASLLDAGLPGAKRGLKWSYPTWTGNRNVVALVAYDDRVNLQFFQGASLPDPTGRLEGTGQAMRHIKIRSAKELKDPAVKALVRHAWRLDQA